MKCHINISLRCISVHLDTLYVFRIFCNIIITPSPKNMQQAVSYLCYIGIYRPQLSLGLLCQVLWKQILAFKTISRHKQPQKWWVTCWSSSINQWHRQEYKTDSPEPKPLEHSTYLGRVPRYLLVPGHTVVWYFCRNVQSFWPSMRGFMFQESNGSRTAAPRWELFLKTVTQGPKLGFFFLLCKYIM